MPPRPKLFIAATLTLLLSLGFLPGWDGLQHHTSSTAIGLIGLAALLTAFLRTRGRIRWGVFLGCVLFIVLYSSISGGAMLDARSREVDRLPSCETGAAPPGGALAIVVTPNSPHLKNGTACVTANEGRDEHRRWEPGGDLFDGFRQVIVRFPGDETRLIVAPMIALFLVTLAGVLLSKTSDSPLQ